MERRIHYESSFRDSIGRVDTVCHLCTSADTDRQDSSRSSGIRGAHSHRHHEPRIRGPNMCRTRRIAGEGIRKIGSGGMIRFKRFKANRAAEFEIDGQLKNLTLAETRKLRTAYLSQSALKGTSPPAEEIKFALDRWPGTELHKRIYKK
jgi:hypothetical protein